MRDMERMFGMSDKVITARVREKFPHIPIRGASGGKRKAS